MGVTFTIIILLNSTVIGGKATKFENNDLAQGGHCTDSSLLQYLLIMNILNCQPGIAVE